MYCKEVEVIIFRSVNNIKQDIEFDKVVVGD